MITSIELAKFSGMDHLACCISLYEILEKMPGNPARFQVCLPDAFYYAFDDDLGRRLLTELEDYEAEI